MTAAYSQLTASMHCAPAGNLIGAAGAQALLQAVRSSTGRLTALDLSGDFAPLGAAGSYAIVTGHPFGISASRLEPWLFALGCAALLPGRLPIQHAGLSGSRCLQRCYL